LDPAIGTFSTIDIAKLEICSHRWLQKLLERKHFEYLGSIHRFVEDFCQAPGSWEMIASCTSELTVATCTYLTASTAISWKFLEIECDRGFSLAGPDLKNTTPRVDPLALASE
jgi:hypothetical protein